MQPTSAVSMVIVGVCISVGATAPLSLDILIVAH